MKKLLLPILFLVMALTSMSQEFVTVDGTVTDTATGNPIPNHAVSILVDSTAGWFYYKTVYTDISGHYFDSVPVQGGGDSGIMFVSTFDCLNNLHRTVITFNPVNSSFTVDFSICNPCGADFTSYHLQGLTVQFTDASSGGGDTRHWYFGDGGTSTQLNPVHTYAQPGDYNVLLILGSPNLPCYDSAFQIIHVWDSVAGPCHADFTYFHFQTDPMTIHFTNASGGGNGVNLWNFGDGASSTEENPIHTYMQTGQYFVGLSIGDSASGCFDYTYAVILVGDSVAEPCHAAFAVYPDSNAVYSYQFLDQSTGNITSWNWHFGDGQTSDLQNPSHVYAVPGIYAACLSIWGADSTCFDISCDTIVVGNTPTCNAEFSYFQPAARMVYFNNNSVGGNGIYLWNFGDGTFSAETSPVHIYPSGGNYIVGLSIGDSASSCFDFTSMLVNVWDTAGGTGCHAAFRIDSDSLNPTYTFHFVDQSTGNLISRVWDFGDGATSIEQNPTHTYSENGTYNACLTIHGADSSCYDVTCKILAIGTSPACHAQFTYYNDSLNAELIIQFVDQSTAGTGSISSWFWQFGDGTTSSLQNPAHTYPTNGTYVASLTIQGADSSCFDYTFDSVFVGTGPGCHAYFTYAINPPPGNRTVIFTDLSLSLPTSWLWIFGDGTVDTVQNPVHTYATPGTYNVCLQITDNNCTSTFCQDVVLYDSSYFHMIYGQVFAGNFPVTAGLAMIFSSDSAGNSGSFVAVCPTDSNGVYYFTMVPDGNYFILAVPFDSAGFLPTYYGDVINWEQATVISLGIENNPYNINLVPSGSLTPGPGSASGQIIMAGLKETIVDKVNMILMDAQGNAIGFTRVSTAGAFNFPTMAYGTYLLHAEMPGITSDQVMITLTPEDPHAEVIMTYNGNSILGLKPETSIVNSWNVYPNPVIDQLTFSIDVRHSIKAEIGLYNFNGQLLSGSSVVLHDGNNKIPFSTASLPVGLYTLRLTSSEGVNIVAKVVKTK